MNKQELIELLKNAEAGSDELNVAYYDWKHPDMRMQPNTAGRYMTGKTTAMPSVYIKNVTNSVDAALGEIPEGSYLLMDYDTDKEEKNGATLMQHGGDGPDNVLAHASHKSLPIAILLAVVEASV